ncbi:hypothetical protein CLV31_109115 [Algoriphagus aquaeductus]|uniref:Uncharacterized protein n=2 Tax=Algoriphagus aquaeductus TaxID=475299 RepID=A0A326RPJ1_9BACT|nr:hypothetical protein CLV31_109115 [Algoriphagus aquaeductus]
MELTLVSISTLVIRSGLAGTCSIISILNKLLFMTRFTALLIFSILFSVGAKAQEIQGKLVVGSKSKVELTLKSNQAVDLYAAFREQNHPIHFVFEGKSLPQTSSGQEVALIWFRTTLKKDGKVISKLERAPMPFFPGDMLMPVETFDFIAQLSAVNGKPDLRSEIPAGNYEVLLDAGPVGSKGQISSAVILFAVK